ncbi:transglutaminase family protein [Phenylobacterium sp.]|uniref:transglutaminase family protein n=1 Tax=Phenylobacterium sp. TaxID=1871053 RepID=UPI00273244E2|nr:transglutaminase family protein [Phenylobacterium sp.]MDP3172909.1 transglutaminase family protein [Phenylobacterium sp.]MDP3659543.1 transglutaminase family protein [Phenylobacterium sp.]
MTRLTLRHETLYTYEKPVRFAPHRLLIRPRDSHAMRIVASALSFSPAGSTRWTYDALGNSVCWLTPQGEADQLSIVSELVIERFPAPLSPLRIDNPRTVTPIVYDNVDRTILNPFIEPETLDSDDLLLKWLRAQVGPAEEPALDYLLRLNQTIHAEFAYSARVEEGTQDPAHTVATRSGTCRDFAWLMVEALRRLGFAARFVTGYLYSPATSVVRGAGATHAWCEVFLPDLGWVEFDPTNGLAESADLIPVAVSRSPAQAAPVTGAIYGDGGYSQLTVHVDVRLGETLSVAA